MVLKFRPVGFTSHGIAHVHNTLIQYTFQLEVLQDYCSPTQLLFFPFYVHVYPTKLHLNYFFVVNP